MNLKVKFSLWMILLVLFVVTAGGLLQIVSERQLLLQERDEHHTKIIQRLAQVSEESLYQSDLILFNFIDTLKQERGFVSAAFVDSDGVIRIHSDPKQAGQSIPHIDKTKPTEQLSLTHPVFFSGEKVGLARLLFDQAKLDQYLYQALLRTAKRIGVVMLLSLILGIGAAWLLASALVRPINKIVHGMRKVSKGTLDPIPPVRTQDEMAWLGQELNIMIVKLKELNEMKQNFFSRITHELKSPLIAVEGLVSMSLKGKAGHLSNKLMNWLLMIRNNNLRTQRLVEDLLTTSKLEAGGEILKMTDFDMNPLIDQVVEPFLPQAEEKNIHLNVSHPNQPIFVHADKEMIRHVLNNLLSNAVKFTDKGEVSVGLSKNNGSVKVSVNDTGPGISSKDKERIFQKYFRTTESKNIKGTGLGLAIVKELVEAHKGKISVTDRSEGGSVFLVTLPHLK